jgi:hypothetical protein
VEVWDLFDTIELRESSDEEAIAGDGGGGHAHFVQGILAEEFVFGPGLEDVGVAIFAEREDFAVGSPGRGSKGGVAGASDALLIVDEAPGTRVVAAQKSEIEEDIEVFAIDKRRWVVGTGAGLMPGDVLAVGFTGSERNVTGGARFECENGANFVPDISGRDIEESEFGERCRDGDRGHAAAFPKRFPIEVIRTDAFRAGSDKFDAFFVLPDVRSGPVAFFIAIDAPELAAGFGVQSEGEGLVVVVVDDVEPAIVEDWRSGGAPAVAGFGRSPIGGPEFAAIQVVTEKADPGKMRIDPFAVCDGSR